MEITLSLNGTYNLSETTDALPVKQVQTEPEEDEEDHFEHAIPRDNGYSNFSTYRSIKNELAGIIRAELPKDGVPSPVSVMTALEALQDDILYRNTTPPANQANMVKLLKQLM